MRRPLRVLLVEDSDRDALLLLRELRQGGYEPTHERVEDAAGMMAALERQGWDVIVSDYKLPRFSGPAALKLLQGKNLDLPFIIVSGQIDEETAVASMKAGAHDYVMKDRLTRLAPAIEREMAEADVRRARKRADEQFAREQAFRRAIEDSVPSGIGAVDMEGRLIYVNPSFCEMVGWSEAELVGSKPPFPYWPPEETPAISASLSRTLKGQTPEDGVELRFQHRDGQRFDVFLQTRRLHDERGEPAGWLASITDITERKRAQEALRRAHQELEQRVRERTVDLMTANANLETSIRERQRLENELLEITEKERRRIGLDLHDDLGQKLAGLTLMMKGLEVGLTRKKLPEAEEARKISALINQTVNHASGLARDLTLGELEEKNLPEALRDLAANVESLFTISCRFKTEGSIPALERGVMTQFYKIAQEAVTNAVKHGKAREVGIELVKKPRHLLLTVRNNGLTFPALIDNNRGMGLRIMNYRANLIGAELEVKPRRPKGAIVSCTLPLGQDTRNKGNGNGKHASSASSK